MYLTSVYVCHVPDYVVVVVVVVVSAIGGNPVSISIQYMSDNCVYSQTHLNQISISGNSIFHQDPGNLCLLVPC